MDFWGSWYTTGPLSGVPDFGALSGKSAPGVLSGVQWPSSSNWKFQPSLVQDLQAAYTLDPDAIAQGERFLQNAKPMLTGEMIDRALYDSWPSRLARGITRSAISGFTAPYDAMTGKFDPSSEEGIGRALDMAGLMTFGGGAAPATASEMRSGLSLLRRPPTNLPMDYVSRMARAREMGFLPRPWFHGTNRNFTAFDPTRLGTRTGAESARLGVWLAADPDLASYFARSAAGRAQRNAQVYPLVLRSAKAGRIRLKGDELDQQIAATLAETWDKGFDTVLFQDTPTRGGDLAIVRDPAQLRSIWATFDPAKRDSANILYSGGNPISFSPLGEPTGSNPGAPEQSPDWMKDLTIDDDGNLWAPNGLQVY